MVADSAEERILSPREFREKCEDLRLYGAGDETGDPRAKDKLAMSHEALRSRLVEAMNERGRWRAEFDKASDNLAAVCEELGDARRRADRLEEALEEIADVSMDTFREDPPRLDEIYKIARSALDSREDEVEDCTCHSNPPESEGPTARVRDPDCPVHGKGEGDKVRRKFDLAYQQAESRFRTSEKGSWREGYYKGYADGMCKTRAIDATADRPTHADARSSEPDHDADDVRQMSDEELVEGLESLAINFCQEAGFGYMPVKIYALEIKRRLSDRHAPDEENEDE